MPEIGSPVGAEGICGFTRYELEIKKSDTPLPALVPFWCILVDMRLQGADIDLLPTPRVTIEPLVLSAFSFRKDPG